MQSLQPFRYLELTYPDLASNLALDEALLIDAEARPGRPILRIWQPETLAVVLGASGRLQADVEVERCQRDGVAIGRRSSGGGTVLIGPGIVNFSVVLPIDADPKFKAVDTAQVLVLEIVAESLRRAGKPVEVQGSGDLTINHRKFSGSAQRRLRHWFMVHATVLNQTSIELIERYLKPPVRQPSYRDQRSHHDFLTILDLPNASLLAAIQDSWPLSASSNEPNWIDHALIHSLVAERFGQSSWIERL